MTDDNWQVIEDPENWNDSLAEVSSASFLQAFEFGEFHEKLGNKVWRLGLKRNGKIVGFSQVVKLQTKFGKFLYITGGPIIEDLQRDTESLIVSLKKLAKLEQVSFIRFDPRVISEKDEAILQEFGLIQAQGYTQPQCSLFLDLTKTFEELKGNLSDSTRYNVGWVERKGIRIVISKEESDFVLFNKLIAETAKRHNFSLYKNGDYYLEQFLSFKKEGKAKLFLAFEPEEFGQDVLACAVVIYFGDTATYLHAASSIKSPKLRAPYLMQWKIIEDAKASGFKKYDFWGVAKDDNPKDPWAGVTEFKRSFGGSKVYYQKPYDLVINNTYYIQTLLEKTRPFLKKLLIK